MVIDFSSRGHARSFGKLISFDDALSTILENIHPVERIEEVALDDSLGRVLAENVYSWLDAPPFTRVAMDGYAVRSIDIAHSCSENPVRLGVKGRLNAGDFPATRVDEGTCIQVATGVKLPPGADAVVMVEDIETIGNFIEVFKPVPTGANIGRQGEDIEKGALILSEGQIVSPGKLGMLASQGMICVKVYEKPKVAVISTGSEIIDVDQPISDGQIYDINSHTISAVIRQSGAEVVKFRIQKDDFSQLANTLARAASCDAVVFSGGSSLGQKDLLEEVLSQSGNVLFHGVRIKPGKPTMFAVVNGKPVFGMPGYPTSCLINTYLLLGPAIRKAAHLAPLENPPVSARLSCELTNRSDRMSIVPVYIEGGRAIPIFKQSGAISATALASGYLVVAEDTHMVKGSIVEVFPLRAS